MTHILYILVLIFISLINYKINATSTNNKRERISSAFAFTPIEEALSKSFPLTIPIYRVRQYPMTKNSSGIKIAVVIVIAVIVIFFLFNSCGRYCCFVIVRVRGLLLFLLL